MRGLGGIHPVAWVLVGLVAVASWACSSSEGGSPAREATESAESAESAVETRPAYAVPEGAEQQAWQAADRELFPDDIRDDLGAARHKKVGWVGVVEQTEMTQYEDRFSMATTARHHYFDWRAPGEDGVLHLSEAGEGLFRVVWTLPKGPTVVTPQDAWEYGRPGLLLFAYGDPVGVKKSVVTLRVQVARVEPQDSYAVDGEYGRPGGSPLVGTRWRLIAQGLDGVPPELEITVEWREDGELAGGAGCNRFSGTYTVFGERLTVGPLATTRMACEPEAMAWEQRVLEALGAVTRHERNAKQLLLHGATPEARLRLRPADVPGPPAAPPQFDLRAEDVDADIAEAVRGHLEQGQQQVEAFFGGSLGGPLPVGIAPDREAFDDSLPEDWGLGRTQCWMVATGVADRLVVLSPRVWSREACEHDGEDADHVRDILVHELVHVYHGRHNPTGDFTGAEELGWFIEGLAVHVSGQLEGDRLAPAREAVETGAGPQSLATAWSGRYRYGVCGSLVAYLDATYGREALTRMLSATTQEELLGPVDLTEEQLLERWRSFVLAD